MNGPLARPEEPVSGAGAARSRESEQSLKGCDQPGLHTSHHLLPSILRRLPAHHHRQNHSEAQERLKGEGEETGRGRACRGREVGTGIWCEEERQGEKAEAGFFLAVGYHPGEHPGCQG